MAEKKRITIQKPDSSANFMGIKEIIIFVVLVGTVATLKNGYHYGLVDQMEQLPKLFRMMNPSYLVKDFYVNVSMGITSRYYYLKFISSLTSICSIPLCYLLLTWLSHIFITLITYYMANDIFKGSSLSSMVASILVMSVDSLVIGGNACYLHSAELTPHLLALPLALLALWAGIRGYVYICCLLSVVASLLHPLVGLETGGIALATAGISNLFNLFDNGKADSRRRVTRMVHVLLSTFIVCILTYFLWLIHWNAIVDPTLSSERFIYIYAYFRNPHHCVPSTFGVQHYFVLFSFLVAFGISWRWWYDDKSTDKRLAYRVLIPIILVLVLAVGGYVFVELIPSRIWVIAQTFRLFFIVEWLGLIVVAGTIARLLYGTDRFEQSWSGWLIFIGVGRVQPVIMLMGHLVQMLRERFSLIWTKNKMYFGYGIVSIVIFLLIIGFGSADELLSLFVLINIAFWYVSIRKKWYRNVVPMILLFSIIGLFAVNRYYNIPLFSKYLDKWQPIITLSDLKGPEFDIARYANINTPMDAVFLTPPSFGHFRIVAERAIVLDFKNFSQMQKWYERVIDCYGEVKSTGFRGMQEMERNYKDITDDKIIFVAKKYGVSYAVLYKETLSNFPVVFQNKSYKMIRVEAENTI